MPRNANDVSAARSIAADWGSSQLRLYLCAGDGQVLDQCGGPGIAALRGGQHAGIIATAISPWRQAHGALPLRMAGERLPVRSNPPRLGEHTAELLASLGYDAVQISAMQAAQAAV